MSTQWKPPHGGESENMNRLAVPGVARNRLAARAKAAAGKALIVYLATGSLGAAVVAFIIFKLMGC
jgi:hypothetical protein